MSTDSAITLSEWQLDALTELVNLGVSNAAASLGEMVREEVILSVPKVSVVTRAEAIANLSERDATRLVAVHQEFEGAISGRALLIFPEAKSMELVRAVVGSELSLEDLMELEQEALAETGNVLLNGCLGTIANSLERTLRISLPEVAHGESAELFTGGPNPETGASVLFIYINFAVRQRDIQGYIAMLMDLPSLVALKQLLTEFIERSTGQTLASDHVQ